MTLFRTLRTSVSRGYCSHTVTVLEDECVVCFCFHFCYFQPSSLSAFTFRIKEFFLPAIPKSRSIGIDPLLLKVTCLHAALLSGFKPFVLTLYFCSFLFFPPFVSFLNLSSPPFSYCIVKSIFSLHFVALFFPFP